MGFDDVVAQGESQASALPTRLGGEKRLKDLVSNHAWYTGAIVRDGDLDLAAITVADQSGGEPDHGF